MLLLQSKVETVSKNKLNIHFKYSKHQLVVPQTYITEYDINSCLVWIIFLMDKLRGESFIKFGLYYFLSNKKDINPF